MIPIYAEYYDYLQRGGSSEAFTEALETKIKELEKIALESVEASQRELLSLKQKIKDLGAQNIDLHLPNLEALKERVLLCSERLDQVRLERAAFEQREKELRQKLEESNEALKRPSLNVERLCEIGEQAINERSGRHGTH